MNHATILNLGAQMRASMLNGYHMFGNADGSALARRYIFELGEVMSDIHGRKEAAAVLYSIADAVTCKLPIEDFRLPPTQKQPPTADAEAAAEKSLSFKLGELGAATLAAANRNSTGFVAGLLAGLWWGVASR